MEKLKIYKSFKEAIESKDRFVLFECNLLNCNLAFTSPFYNHFNNKQNIKSVFYLTFRVNDYFIRDLTLKEQMYKIREHLNRFDDWIKERDYYNDIMNFEECLEKVQFEELIQDTSKITKRTKI